MRKTILILSIFLIIIHIGRAQDITYVETDLNINKYTDGTLTTPSSNKSDNLIIFIQGSGPVDRDGNQPMMKNDAIKKLARQLAENGIASFRYDKRIFKMQELRLKEKDLRFEDFVEDAKDIITYFKEKDQFKNIIIAGHDEGSLIGMLAARENADAFISLAGAGEPIDNIIVQQINKQAPPLAENARKAFDEMKENGRTSNYNPMLESIFRTEIQAYMLSWMNHNPSEEIAKLEIPVLIIGGTADIQVEQKEAEILKDSAKNAKLSLIYNMNHIFRNIDSRDQLVNTKSYNEPNQPLHPEIVTVITEFIKELK